MLSTLQFWLLQTSAWRWICVIHLSTLLLPPTMKERSICRWRELDLLCPHVLPATPVPCHQLCSSSPEAPQETQEVNVVSVGSARVVQGRWELGTSSSLSRLAVTGMQRGRNAASRTHAQQYESYPESNVTNNLSMSDLLIHIYCVNK